MIALLAILQESYQSLKAQRLFKTVLVLSVLVIIGFASFGFNDEGMSMFFGAVSFESEFFTANSEMAKTLYMGIFSAFIVNIWLAWVATILALISTSSIFPTFLSEGAVELVMSKPVRRTTLFLAKYLGGLLFAILQVSLFCLGAFLVVGWRVGEWNASIFLAIPLVTIFFSYLFCVNVFLGVVTRSTLVALLFTLLFWFMTFGVRTADDILHVVLYQTEAMVEHNRKHLESTEAQLIEYKRELAELESDGSESGLSYYRSQVDLTQANVEDREGQLATQDKLLGQLEPWVVAIEVLRWPLPETSRTIGLLQRWLDHGRDVKMNDIISGKIFEEDEYDEEREFNQQREAELRMLSREEQMSAANIIGRSLLFELIVLVMAWWVFVRRDY